MKLKSAGQTDIGRSREHNEDSMLVFKKKGLFAVCDGLGGHSAGEVASGLAVKCIKDIVQERPAIPQGFHEASAKTRLLAWAVSETGRLIYDQAQADSARAGMGTTATAAWFHGSRVSLAHVGDSRAYLFREGKLVQLTEDHSFVAEQVRAGVLTPEEARNSLHRNVITRALGTQQTVQVDVYEHEVRVGDRLLLCSDGLTAVLSDTEIRLMMEKAGQPRSLCASFIDEANARGGPDNITAVVIYSLQEDEKRRRKGRSGPQWLK
jgi:serine/threonine protein phosphatase PrpC